MPFEPLRFIHTADLLLGEQPREPVRALADVRHQLMRLTFAAFDRVVQACLNEAVDFLLLTGSSFVEAHRDLQARLHLLGGLRRLDAAGIRTFVKPGPLDGAAAWRSLPGVPEGVTVFADDDDDPVAVIREGRVVATVSGSAFRGTEADRTARPEAAHSDARRSPFTIGMLSGEASADRERLSAEETAAAVDIPPAAQRATPSGSAEDATPTDLAHLLGDSLADYVALGSGPLRRTVRLSRGLTHFPGAPHALSFAEAGRRGCTLVEVDADREMHCRLLPTATVRFHTIPVRLEPAAADDDIVLEMLSRLNALEPGAQENTWVIRWELEGPREELARFETAQHRKQWQQALLEAMDEPPVPHLAFSWEAAPPAAMQEPVHAQVTEYLAHISQSGPVTHERLRALFERSPFSAERLEQLRTYLDHADPARIENLARSLGTAWFPSPSEQEAA